MIFLGVFHLLNRRMGGMVFLFLWTYYILQDERNRRVFLLEKLYKFPWSVPSRTDPTVLSCFVQKINPKPTDFQPSYRKADGWFCENQPRSNLRILKHMVGILEWRLVLRKPTVTRWWSYMRVGSSYPHIARLVSCRFFAQTNRLELGWLIVGQVRGGFTKLWLKKCFYSIHLLHFLP